MSKKKILIFVVAYNAEKTITDVLKRIELDPQAFDIEILVIDDASDDATFEHALESAKAFAVYKITILRNRVNQGYGGNQKLGYQYAINHNYDVVVLLHGDGQYAPEIIGDLIKPVIENKADAVFGSRMLIKGGARKGGMPLYKYVGNKILTNIQNLLLNTRLSEFHSGYRVYSTRALKRLPFEFNSNDFHFDTQIIIQLIAGNMRITELPIPTYYGDEICYVSGMKYAWNVLMSTFAYGFHRMGIFYQFHYDVEPEGTAYSPKIDYLSPHSAAITLVKENSTVFDIGCGPFSDIADILTQKKSCRVYALEYTRPQNMENLVEFFERDLDADELPEPVSGADYVLLLDVLEHLKRPEEFLLHLREKCNLHAHVLISVPNVAFFPVRLMLLLGRFNYGRAGILDKTHTRLFTYSSFRKILKQSGFVVNKIRGIPAPFEKALGKKGLAKILLNFNRFLIFIKKRMFAYQFFAEVQRLPVVQDILKETLETSKQRIAAAKRKKNE